MYGLIDFSRITTRPGGFGPFAPPVGWQGDYWQYLQVRFAEDIGVRQQILVVRRILVRQSGGTRTRFLGPHAVEAREFALSAGSSLSAN
ncbi:MAG: hypothetical protein V5B40_07000 [Candidatus Accumulibacter meliphilus]|jgi:hypothetical protein|uniref:hypothetical protein n=1 Tax=Candidatus Accumulibacter meliphilus TaxID=2211374 RepID=UPI002FC2AB00